MQVVKDAIAAYTTLFLEAATALAKRRSIKVMVNMNYRTCTIPATATAALPLLLLRECCCTDAAAWMLLR